MVKPLVAIFTANSNSGTPCLKELVEKYSDKVQVRAVFRSEEKAKPYRAQYPNIEIITGADASKPETLKKAFENAQYALIVTPHDPTAGFSDDAGLTENMINHAVENGVKYIVLVGSWSVVVKDKIKIISNRFVAPEELLEKLGNEKGLKWTVLRGGFFMENLLNPQLKQSIQTQSTFNYPKVFIPPIDTRDIGKSAAACFAADDIDKHHGKKYEMHGNELLSSEDIAKIFSKVLGREIKYQETPKDVLKKVLPEALFEIFEYMIDNSEQAIPITHDVKDLTGQNGSLEAFLTDHKSYFE